MWLRQRCKEHNQQVLVLSILAAGIAFVLWYVAYAGVFWVVVVANTVVHGVDARPPESLPALFIYAAATLVVVSLAARQFALDDRPRDKKASWEVAAEIILAVPRATIAVCDNFGAWQRLDARELRLAAGLLRRLVRERRLSLHSLPLEVPSPDDRRRIVLSLQLLGAIEIRRHNAHSSIYLATRLRPALERVGRSALFPRE